MSRRLNSPGPNSRETISDPVNSCASCRVSHPARYNAGSGPHTSLPKNSKSECLILRPYFNLTGQHARPGRRDTAESRVSSAVRLGGGPGASPRPGPALGDWRARAGPRRVPAHDKRNSPRNLQLRSGLLLRVSRPSNQNGGGPAGPARLWLRAEGTGSHHLIGRSGSVMRGSSDYCWAR